MIPKKIHQVWLGDKPLPDHMKEWAEEWKALYPDFEYKLWTSNDFRENQWTKICEEYNMYDYLSDWVRANIIYQEGGIYIDTDVKPVKEIPKKYFNASLALPTTSRYMMSNYFIMSRRKTLFFKNLLEIYKNFNEDHMDRDKWVATETYFNAAVKTFGKFSVTIPQDGSLKTRRRDLALFMPDETAPFHPFNEGDLFKVPDVIPEETFCIHYWNWYKTKHGLNKTDFSHK